MDDKWDQHGILWPFVLPIGQSWFDIGAVFGTIQYMNIRTMVEIGINQGGISSLMYGRKDFDPGFAYFGIEIFDHVVDSRLPKAHWKGGFSIKIGDIFQNEAWLRECVDRSGRTLVLCDGGNKAGELKFVLPTMRNGDVVLVHDYQVEFLDSDIPTTGVKRITPWWVTRTHYWMGEKI